MFKYFDLFLLLAALPVFLAAHLPMLGYVGVFVGWGGQRIIQYILERKAERAEDAKDLFRLIAGSLIGRSWFLVMSVFAVGIIERPAGLAAAVAAAVIFTAYLAISLVTSYASPKLEDA